VNRVYASLPVGGAHGRELLRGADLALERSGSAAVELVVLDSGRELAPAVAERTRFFVAQRAPLGFYGYEAMSLILDAIAAAGADRAAVARVARSTNDRDSVIGRYSIDADGHTTSTAYGRLAVIGGELAWDRG
jgi:hypothetical protein